MSDHFFSSVLRMSAFLLVAHFCLSILPLPLAAVEIICPYCNTVAHSRDLWCRGCSWELKELRQTVLAWGLTPDQPLTCPQVETVPERRNSTSSLTAGQRSSLDHLLKSARQALDGERLIGAVNFARAILNFDARNEEALEILIKARIAQELWPEARQQLALLYQVNPGSAMADQLQRIIIGQGEGN